MGTEDAIEREVQRRVSEILSSAGVSHGRVSHEVLFMLPPEFIRAYTRLFDRALLESVKGGKGPDQGTPKKVDAKHRGKMPMTGGGGKRFRTHWVIRDEDAFKAKGSIDRKLRRLTRDIEMVLGYPQATASKCHRCQIDLMPARDVLAGNLRFCPSCGSDLRPSVTSEQSGTPNHD
jgi:hypothetical protein